MDGWISLHRKIQDHWLWEDKPYSKGQAWIDLLMMANHQDNQALIGNTPVDIKRGSFITSEVKLSKRWGWGRKKVRTFLDVLEIEKMLAKKSTSKYTSITIENYELYQNQGTTKEQQWNNEGTAKEHQRNTNNNDNNDNKDNNLLFMYSENLKKVVKLLQENIGVIPPVLVDLVSEYSEVFDAEMFTEAVIIATNKKVRTIKYVLGILKQWQDNNILTKDDLEAFRVQRELERETKKQTKQKQYSSPVNKKTKFHNFEQRSSTYTADQLEEIANKKRQKHKNSVNGLAFLEKYKNGTNEEDLL